jgi:hypothetical protein
MLLALCTLYKRTIPTIQVKPLEQVPSLAVA